VNNILRIHWGIPAAPNYFLLFAALFIVFRTRRRASRCSAQYRSPVIAADVQPGFMQRFFCAMIYSGIFVIANTASQSKFDEDSLPEK
jgi:hypothetical protein